MRPTPCLPSLLLHSFLLLIHFLEHRVTEPFLLFVLCRRSLLRERYLPYSFLLLALPTTTHIGLLHLKPYASHITQEQLLDVPSAPLGRASMVTLHWLDCLMLFLGAVGLEFRVTVAHHLLFEFLFLSQHKRIWLRQFQVIVLGTRWGIILESAYLFVQETALLIRVYLQTVELRQGELVSLGRERELVHEGFLDGVIRLWLLLHYWY